MLNQFNYTLPQEIESGVKKTLEDWRTSGNVNRIWNKDASVWTNSDEDKWLGWLGIAEKELSGIQKYHDLADDVRSADFENLVLLGMGGSSLCPEVLAVTFGVENFHILDSTVPAQIKTLESKIDVSKTLFFVASKSGSTLEPNTFFQFFWEKVSAAVGSENAGRHFIAITDPDSKLHKLAAEENFRHIFFGEPSVGGRFSALSVFGMVPGAAMGIDVDDFLKRALEMVNACKTDLPSENPGVLLGAILGVCHQHGRDKLTIFTSPELYDAGAWLEQLIAESTGKNGVSIIPIDRERFVKAVDYDEDRIFVYLKLKDTKDNSLDSKISSLEAYEHPFVEIELADKTDLGQEFFRLEFATAVAGAIMSINPFDQPDVEAAKVEAKALTEKYEETGELPHEEPFFEEGGIKLFSSEKYIEQLNNFVGVEKSLEKYINAHIIHLQEYDYFAVLAYLEMNAENERLLQELRHKVLKKELTATALGFGPRFLHSTGQAYKGGANNGVFLQITSEDAEDIPVPGQKYTFGVVKAAQSRGDFQVLLDRDRRALRLHIGESVKHDLEKILSLIT
ncbi:MAG: bifunctional transaldolase/phosoglucose isomerase [Pyrinomonadaceae bacterium]